MRSRNDRQRGRGPVRERAVFEAAHDPRPQRVRRQRRLQSGRQQRQVLVDRRRGPDVLDRVHHAFADAARRHVDHPPQAHVVVRVDDEAHVGERVLDFLALVEPDAADDLVGDPFAHQRVFNRPRLRVRPVQDRHRRLDIVGERAACRPGDEVGLLELVAAAEVHDAVAALAFGPEMLVLAVAVLADHGGRGVQDDLRRAVVAFELDDRRFAEVRFEVDDVPQVGAAPLVNRLIRIADDAEVAMDLGEAPDEEVLRPVGVLVLVDHHVAELLRVFRADAFGLLEQVDRLQQQIVEVERAALLQGVEVVRVDLRDPLVAPVVAGGRRRSPRGSPSGSWRC